MRLLVLALVAGCLESDQDWGTVYDCGGGIEYCYVDDAADEVSRRVGLRCEPSGLGEREWPAIANFLSHGCIYSCKQHSGCNAHQGCLCDTITPRRSNGANDLRNIGLLLNASGGQVNPALRTSGEDVILNIAPSATDLSADSARSGQ